MLGKKVFKKSSANNEICVYLGKRDFYEGPDAVDPIDGMVSIDKDSVGDAKVFARLSVTFNYGMEELDMIGMNLQKELHREVVQVYPPVGETPKLSPLQQKLKDKLGSVAYPFVFKLPLGMPSSVTLQNPHASSDNPSKHAGVDYEVICYLGKSKEDKPHKKTSVRLNVRKLTYLLPSPDVPPPRAGEEHKFLLGSKPLVLRAALDRELYYHEQPILIHVDIDNQSAKVVKSIIIQVRQFSQLKTGSSEGMNSKCTVASVESTTGFPIKAGKEVSHQYTLIPRAQENRDQIYLALDGQLKDEDTCLASSTKLIAGEEHPVGIIVSYDVKVKLVVGGMGSDVSVKLPFSLSLRNPRLDFPQPQRGSLPRDAPVPPSEHLVVVRPGGGIGVDMSRSTPPASPSTSAKHQGDKKADVSVPSRDGSQTPPPSTRVPPPKPPMPSSLASTNPFAVPRSSSPAGGPPAKPPMPTMEDGGIEEGEFELIFEEFIRGRAEKYFEPGEE